jgi:lysophospholipase L1-like esterase
LIAIGVNDAIRGEVQDEFFSAWEKKYDQAILLAKQMSGNKVAVLTILPVEKGKSLGDQYFSIDKIQALNQIIINLANKHGVMLIDQHAAFRLLYEANKPFTTDGVHLNVSAYRLMKETLRKATVDW